MLKPLTVWIMTNCEKLLERREYQRWEYRTMTCLLRKLYAVKEATVRLIGSRWRKYDRAVCCHPVCLTYALSTS